MLAGVVIAVVAVRGRAKDATAVERGNAHADARGVPVPRLVDLGAGKWIPCKAMAPILEQLRTDYAGRLEIEFIDVWQHPDRATPYRVHLIPYPDLLWRGRPRAGPS